MTTADVLIRRFVRQQAQAWYGIDTLFRDGETTNGPGSTQEFTAPLRDWLPSMFKRHNIRMELDAPCGDWNWMQLVDLSWVDYVGWDVHAQIIERNRIQWPQYRFRQVNLLTNDVPWPAVDLIICRDFLIHLPNGWIQIVLNRMRASGSRYLLTTNFPRATNDDELPPQGHAQRAGYWARRVNLEAPPFKLGGRVETLQEATGREQLLLDLQADYA